MARALAEERRASMDTAKQVARMKIEAKVWAAREGQVFLRTHDGEASILLDEATFERLKPVGIDVEEGDVIVIDAAIIRRTRPERQA
jgi:DNA helicase TIP49 (TBP-interacting protein)